MSTNCVRCVINDRSGPDMLCDRCRGQAAKDEPRELPALGAAWLQGYIEGLKAYAWWKDGTQYVGTCGTTLTEAIKRAKEEYGS